MIELGWIEVEYDEAHWRVLREKRSIALNIMRVLHGLGLVIVHGSVARGDVRESSDIDVVIVDPVPPSLVELRLEEAGFEVYRKLLVQATPSYVPKVYFILDDREEKIVSMPLARLRKREREFYKWGGELDLPRLLRDERVPGVNKDLRLIIPTRNGHREAEIEGMEGVVAKLLGISVDTVRERIYLLTRRKRRGHTGLYIKEEIPRDMPVEEAIMRLRETNKFFRHQTTW